MKDIKSKITQKYFQLLNATVGVPVFVDYAPFKDECEDAYVLITGIASVDASTMNNVGTDTTVQVGIYTKDVVSNSGVTADDIAAMVYSTIYPRQDTLIDLTGDGFCKVSVRLVNDISPDAIQTDSEIFINRIITFRHINITHN